MVSKMSKVGFGIAMGGALLDSILEFTGDNSLPPISNNIGDWAHITLWGGLLPTYVGIQLIATGEREKKLYAVRLGELLPNITTVLMTLYMGLGETILPDILPGTADINDLPYVLAAGLSTYMGLDVIKEIVVNSERNLTK